MSTPGVTITGTIETLAGAGNAGTITFVLVNYGSLIPQISGTAVLAPVEVVCQAAADGTFSQALWGNYQINPINTFYEVKLTSADGRQITVAGYQFNTAGSFDLSSLTPIVSTPGLPIFAGIFPQSTGLTSHQWLNSYTSTTGLFTSTQPAFSDLSGTASTAQVPSLDASKITSGQIGLAQGGTGVDLSASGGTTQILAQDATHVVSARNLVAGDIPNLAASKITSGQVAVARGGTGADLSATGGTSQVLKQTSVGGAVSVGQVAFSDISGSVAASQLPNPSASTLGGIESFTPVSHKWINEITTSGVPLATQPAASDLSNGTTGSGAVVLATAPTIGAATVTSINKMAVTAPATSSTLAVADGKTLTASNTLTLAGTDGTTLTFQGTGTVVNRDSTDVLTNKTIDTAGTGNHIQIAGVDLPSSIGTTGQVLTNNSGVLAFTTVSGGGGGTPGGSTNSIQYNNGSSFSGSMCLTPAGTIAPNAAFKSSIKTFSATGNSDLYTCPANKRAIITEMTIFNGHATNSSSVVAMLKIGGVYYPATPSTSILAQSTGSRSVTYVLEAGEILAVNSTQQPFNVVVSIMEFDNTSNLKSAKLTTSTLTSGDNTVYTVPNGKSALVLNNTLTMCSGTQGTFTAGNNSGGNITYRWNVVPSGGSVGTTNQMSASVTVSTGAGSSQTLTGFTMGAGDFISVNLSAGTSDQIAFVTVVEI